MSSPSDRTDDELPVDERLIAPGTRYEIDDGKLVYVPPADEPHGAAHGALAALLSAHRAPGYNIAIDMLTRTSKTSDIAPDASVYPAARHPVTGGRQLEELAFELLSTTRLSVAASKAAQLVERGVRRVFGIDLGKRRVVEWSRELASWSILPMEGSIEDRALAVPLPLRALVDAVESDTATVRAYRLQRHPEFAAEREEGREEGREEAARDVLRELLAARFGALGADVEARIGEATAEQLRAYVRRVIDAPSAMAVFADEP